MAKLRVGCTVAGWAPGVSTICSSCWFQSTTMAPEAPPAGGAELLLLPDVIAPAALAVPTPSAMPIRTVKAMISFFMLLSPVGGSCRAVARGGLELSFDSPDGAVE